MRKLLVIAAALGLAAPALALDLGGLVEKAEKAAADPNAAVKEAGTAAGQAAADKAAEELTAKLKAVQNEHGPIVFKSGKAVIDVKKSEQSLKTIDGIIKNAPGFIVTIEGHTDSKGKAKTNKALSQKRAEAVVKWLKANLQTPADRMEAKGYGSEKPIADNKTEAGRAKNRRVDFAVRRQ